MISRFSRWRVLPARHDAKRSEPAPEVWLLIEWPEDAPNRIITGSLRSRSSV